MQNFNILASVCSSAGWFYHYLFANSEDGFSHNEAHIYLDLGRYFELHRLKLTEA